MFGLFCHLTVHAVILFLHIGRFMFALAFFAPVFCMERGHVLSTVMGDCLFSFLRRFLLHCRVSIARVCNRCSFSFFLSLSLSLSLFFVFHLNVACVLLWSQCRLIFALVLFECDRPFIGASVVLVSSHSAVLVCRCVLRFCVLHEVWTHAD